MKAIEVLNKITSIIDSNCENKHIYLNYNLTKSKTSGFIESIDYVIERKWTRVIYRRSLSKEYLFFRTNKSIQDRTR